MAYWTGKHLSEEHKAKLRTSLTPILQERGRKQKGVKLSEQHKKKISEGLKRSPLRARPKSEDWRRKISLGHAGKVLTQEHKQNISAGLKRALKDGRRKIRRSSFPGLSRLIAQIRWSSRHLIWRQTCLIRDNFRCRKCGSTESANIEVHHKKSLATLINEAISYMPLLPALDACFCYNPMWDTNNGVTLCCKCHKKTKSFGKNMRQSAQTQRATLGA